MGQDTKKPVIVISRTDKLGDLLLCFPAFYRAREIFPQARIVVLVRRYTADLLYNQSHIDRIVCIDEFPLSKLVQELKSEQPDYFIALYTDKLVGKLARSSGAKHRIGPLSKLHSWFSYNNGIWQKRSRSLLHEYEYNLELVNRLSTKSIISAPYTKLFYKEDNRNVVKDFLSKQEIPENAKLVLINPFTAGSAKNIEINKYLAAGIALLDDVPDAWIIYCAIPTNPLEAVQKNAHPRQRVFVNRGTILNFAALADMASLYIGPPTGTTHIAAFVGIPIVAIYPRIQNQAPKRWAPIGNNKIKIIQPEMPCPQKYGCRKTCPSYDCYKTISAQEIAETAKGLLL